MNQNLQSIGNSADQLEASLHENRCDIAAVTEHWKSHDQLSAYRISGYKLVASFCRDPNTHGGVALYCRKEMEVKQISYIGALVEPYLFECVGIRVVKGTFRCIVVVVYRPPGTNIDVLLNKMCDLLQYLFERREAFFICGDYNVDFRDVANCNTRKFISLLESYNTYYTNYEYTRISGNTKSCLDNILTNMANNYYESEVLNLHVSDHLGLKLTVGIHCKVGPIYKNVRIFSDKNVDIFNVALQNSDWALLYSVLECNVDLQWETFVIIFDKCFNTCFPLKTLNILSSNKNVHNPEINSCRKTLSNCSVLMRHDPKYKQLYNTERNKLYNLLRNAKKSTYNRNIEKSDNKIKAVWNIVREVSGNLLRESEECCTEVGDSPGDVCNRFNDYFINSGNIIGAPAAVAPPLDNVKQSEVSFSMSEVTKNEILQIVKDFKNKHSAGYDDVPVSLLKQVIDNIIDPLHFMINNSIKYGIFPELLKVACVSPVYKNGDKEDMKNFRPISVLPAFSKIIEKILCNRLEIFFNDNNTFHESMHGFLKGRGVETAVFAFLGEILDTLEQGGTPVGVFLDLSKAYDCVDHGILLSKLERCGIGGVPLKLLESFLFDRKQMVKISAAGKSYKSQVKNLLRGLPQGSILAPLLFNVYMVDLPLLFSNDPEIMTVIYADDLTLLIKTQRDNMLQDINRYMERVEEWLRYNGLVLNRDKTHCVVFGPQAGSVVNSSIPSGINPANEVKILGIVVECDIRWGRHVHELSKKLNSVAYSMRVIKRYVSNSVLRLVYYSCFVSRVRFGILFWGASSISDLNGVFVIQKRAVRLLFDIPNRTSCRGVFKRYRLLTVAAIYVYECLIFNFKHKESFQRFRSSHMYDTRNKISYCFPVHRLSVFEKGPCYSGMRFFNLLPNRIKNVTNAKAFKREIFNLLVDIEPYRVQEFFDHPMVATRQ